MHHVLAPALAASFTLLAAAPSSTVQEPVQLVFAPAPGTTVERTVSIATTIESGDLEVVMDDQPVPKQYLPELTFSLDAKEETTLVDSYGAAKGDLVGRSLVREVTDASRRAVFTMDMGDYPGGDSGEWTVDAATPIAGAPVELGRDADGGVVARWVDPGSSPDEALLDGLRPEIDLAGLLPEDPVEIGDAWEADASVLAQIFEPSGNLGWEWQSDGADFMRDAPEVERSGALQLRLAEILDGGVARIVVEGQMVVVETTASNLDQVPVVDGTATDVSTTDYTVEGELLWDVEGGVLRGFTFEGTGDGDQVTTKDPGQEGPSYESTTTHEAKIVVEVECRVARG